MFKYVSSNFMRLITLVFLLNYCTPYSSSSSPNNINPVFPDAPDSGALYDVSTIDGQSDIYTTLKGNSSYNILSSPSGSSADQVTQTVSALGDGSGYQTASLEFNDLENNFSFSIELRVSSDKVSKIHMTQDTEFKLYLVDSDMKTIVNSSKPITYKSASELNFIDVSSYLDNMKSVAKKYEGQNISLISVYEGTDKKHYYIKYPIVYKEVKESDEPNPDSTTWKNISQIKGQSAIYKTLKGKNSYAIVNNPTGTSGGSSTQTVQSLSDGSNYSTAKLEYKALGSYFSIGLDFRVSESKLTEIGLSKDKKVFIYIVDSKMGVVASPKSEKIYSSISLQSSYGVGSLVQNFNDDFAKQYEGQELSVLMVYKIGKETYYIKYPFTYTIVKESDPGVDLDGATNINEWQDISSSYGNSKIYSTITSTGDYSANYNTSQSITTAKALTVKALSNGTGYETLNVIASKSAFVLEMLFKLKYSVLPSDPGSSGEGYSLVLVNANGDILERSKTKLGYYNVTINNDKMTNITSLLSLKKTEYIGKNLSLLLAYKGTDKQVYYVKYPIYMQ